MADKKISQLTAATTPLDGTEVLPIVQSSATVKVANNDLRPKQIQSNATSGVHQIVGPAAGTTRVMTVPDANFTAARTDAAQSFTGTQTFNNDVNTGTLTSTVNQNGVTFTSVFNSNNASGNGAGFQTGKSAADPWIRVWGDHNSGNLYYDTVLTFDKIFRRNMTTTPVNQFKIGGDDNLYPMQAAKGINFTANTAAAGMTSQLLNWYEEGTWTPSVSAGSGTITTLGTVSGTYTRIGRQVVLNFDISITTNGTGGTYIAVSGLPFSAKAAYCAEGVFREVAVNGKLGAISIANTATFTLNNYDSSYPGADGCRLIGTISYIV